MPIIFILLGFVLGGCAQPGTTTTPTPSPSPAAESGGSGWDISETLLAAINFAFVRQFSDTSPDARRFGYAAENGLTMFMVMDGEKGKEYEAIWSPPVFSPDSRRFAYVAERDRKHFIVADTVEGAGYDSIDSLPIFSHDSRQLAYVASLDSQQFMIVNGAEGK